MCQNPQADPTAQVCHAQHHRLAETGQQQAADRHRPERQTVGDEVFGSDNADEDGRARPSPCR